MKNQDRTKNVAHNATEQHRTADAQKNCQRAEIQALYDLAPLGFCVFDTQFRYLRINERLAEINGIPAAQHINHTLREMVPDVADQTEQILRQVIDTGQPILNFEFTGTTFAQPGMRRMWGTHWLPLKGTTGLVTGVSVVVEEITDRKRAEMALRESEERYCRLTESTTDMIYIADRNGNILYANASAAAAMRSDVISIVGKRQEELFSPEVARRHTENIRKVFRTGEKHNTDGVYHFGPKEIWLNTQLIPLQDGTGQIVSVMGVSRNITARKRTETALKQARDELERRVEKRTAELANANKEIVIFRQFVESAGQGFAMASLDGKITYVNPFISHLLADGRSEDIIGNHILKYYPKDYMERREKEIIPQLLRDGHWEGEVVILHGKGSMPVQQNSFLVRDEQGNPAYFATVLTDITERKRAEETLQASEDRYRSVVEDQTEVISRIKTDGTFIFVNDVFCRFFGRSSEELLGCKWQPTAFPDDVPMIEEQLRAISPSNPIMVIENRVHSGLGEVRWMQFVNRGFFDREGRITEIQCVGRDITERKQAEEALQKEYRTLKHMLQSSDHERQLIAYEIHDELAQQLAGAIMQFQTYCHQKETNPKLAAKAYDAGITMLQQGHFETRRLIAGVRPPILDEDGVVAAVAHLVNEQNRLKGPEIEYRSRVSFDRLAPAVENSIYRIAQEGLMNVCQYSKSKKVRVSLVQREDRVRIEIQDWGIGFDTKSVQENCFGLEGIRQRARLLGGKCSIQSKVGKGTRITVELPVVERE